MLHKTRSALIKLAAIAAAVLLFCAPVRAQFGMGGGDMSQFMSPVTKRAVESWAQMVGMDKDQKEAALALQEGYRSSFKSMSAEMQKAFKELGEKVQDTGDWSGFQKEAAKIGKELTEKMEKLEKGFLDDVKSLLTEQQAANWPRVERARRRDNGLRFGFVSGQNVDLVKIMTTIGVKPDASPELDEQVLRYETEMDRKIQAFEKWGKDQQAKQTEENVNMFDMTKIQDMLKEMANLSRDMRDTNRQYAKNIQALLPADKQAKFDMEIKKKSFPRVYRESYVQKALAESERFADLDASQKEAIAQLKAGYERDADSVNKKWAAAIEEREEKQGGSIGAMMAGFSGNADPNDPVGESRKARRDLDDRTKEKLLSLLSEDQKAKLPEDKPDPRDRGGMDFGFSIDPPEEDDE